MAKRKRGAVKNKTVRRTAKRRVSRARIQPKRLIRSSQRKIGIAVKNLILFVILTTASYLLYTNSKTILYQNLFFLLSMILGFVAVAFLVALVTLLFLKAMGK